MHKPPTTISNLIHLFWPALPTAAAANTLVCVWSREDNTFTIHKEIVVFRLFEKKKVQSSAHRGVYTEQHMAQGYAGLLRIAKM